MRAVRWWCDCGVARRVGGRSSTAPCAVGSVIGSASSPTALCAGPSPRSTCCARIHSWSGARGISGGGACGRGRRDRIRERLVRPRLQALLPRCRDGAASVWPAARPGATARCCRATTATAATPAATADPGQRPPPARRAVRRLACAGGCAGSPSMARLTRAAKPRVRGRGPGPAAPRRSSAYRPKLSRNSASRVRRFNSSSRLRARQLAVEKRRDLLTNLFAHVSSGRPRPPSKMGRSFLSIASRARKIRERTVPTGQSIVCAMSS